MNGWPYEEELQFRENIKQLTRSEFKLLIKTYKKEVKILSVLIKI